MFFSTTTNNCVDVLKCLNMIWQQRNESKLYIIKILLWVEVWQTGGNFETGG